jgi:hypothetical protein
MTGRKKMARKIRVPGIAVSSRSATARPSTITKGRYSTRYSSVCPSAARKSVSVASSV